MYRWARWKAQVSNTSSKSYRGHDQQELTGEACRNKRSLARLLLLQMSKRVYSRMALEDATHEASVGVEVGKSNFGRQAANKQYLSAYRRGTSYYRCLGFKAVRVKVPQPPRGR